MNFDPRMSTVRQTPAPNGRGRREEEDNFMTLEPDREIAGCINDIGITFSVTDLQKPNPQQIQKVFEWFAELLMNTARDNVSPAMKAAADDVGGQYSDIFSADTRDLMGFFATLRKLLVECGIHDFSFQDLYRPTRERLVKIFSYIINFIRFREAQTAIIDEHFNKAEKTKQRIEVLFQENRQKGDQLAELEHNRKAAEAAIRDGEIRSNDLKSRLLELKRSQERVAEKLERVRAEQSRLKSILEDKTTQTMTAKQEAHKLRPYTTQSPAALEALLNDLNKTLANDKAQTDALDRRARALQVSCDAFSTVTADIRTCTHLLEELSKDISAEESITAATARNRDAVFERTNNVKDVERQESMLQKQLENVQRRTEKLRRTEEERKEKEGRRLQELKDVNERLKRERKEKNAEIERRRVRIEQTEKKMVDLKENIEIEVQSAHAEYLKMESHIRLYIEEMEQSIT